MKVVGVLAIQGAFAEHIRHFENVIESQSINDLKIIKVSTKESLERCDALVIPGGESSSISLTAERIGLLEPLREFVRNKANPVWGTCAGLIMLSARVLNALESQKVLGGIDIEVKRNAFGRQLNSFIEDLDFSGFIDNCSKFPAVFIRAPVVSAINISQQCSTNDSDISTVVAADYGKFESWERVQILSRLDERHHSLIVATRQGNKLGTSFHPELSEDTRFHQWFLQEFVLK